MFPNLPGTSDVSNYQQRKRSSHKTTVLESLQSLPNRSSISPQRPHLVKQTHRLPSLPPDVIQSHRESIDQTNENYLKYREQAKEIDTRIREKLLSERAKTPERGRKSIKRISLAKIPSPRNDSSFDQRPRKIPYLPLIPNHQIHKFVNFRPKPFTETIRKAIGGGGDPVRGQRGQTLTKRGGWVQTISNGAPNDTIRNVMTLDSLPSALPVHGGAVRKTSLFYPIADENEPMRRTIGPETHTLENIISENTRKLLPVKRSHEKYDIQKLKMEHDLLSGQQGGSSNVISGSNETSTGRGAGVGREMVDLDHPVKRIHENYAMQSDARSDLLTWTKVDDDLPQMSRLMKLKRIHKLIKSDSDVPFEDMQSWMDRFEGGKPRRDPVTGMIIPKNRISSDVTMPNLYKTLSDERHEMQLSHMKNLQKMEKEKYNQNRQDKKKTTQADLQHFETFNSYFNRPGNGAPLDSGRVRRKFSESGIRASLGQMGTSVKASNKPFSVSHQPHIEQQKEVLEQLENSS